MIELSNLKSFIDIINQLISLHQKLKPQDTQLIENLVIEFQASSILKPSNKVQYSLVSNRGTFYKLHYFEKVLDSHNKIITKALINCQNPIILSVLEGLREINSETIDDIQSFTVHPQQLINYMNQEYPPLNSIILKYRYVLSCCLIHLCEPYGDQIPKVKLLPLKKLVSLLETSLDKA